MKRLKPRYWLLGLACAVSLVMAYRWLMPGTKQTIHILLRTDPEAETRFRSFVRTFLWKNRDIAIQIHPLPANQWLDDKSRPIAGWNPEIDIVIGSARQGQFLCQEGLISCEELKEAPLPQSHGLMKLGSHDGKTIGVPLSYADFMMVYYNRSIVKQLPQGHEVLAELLAHWKAAAPQRLGLGISQDAFSSQIFLPLRAMMAGEDIRTLAAQSYGLLGYYLFDTALTPQFCDESCLLQHFKEGRVPAIVANAIHLQDLEGALGDDLAIANPSILGDQNFTPNSSFDGRYLMKTGRPGAPAVDALLSYLTGTEGQSKMASIYGQLPARDDVDIPADSHLQQLLRQMKDEILPDLVVIPGDTRDQILAKHASILQQYRRGFLTQTQAADLFLSHEGTTHE